MHDRLYKFLNDNSVMNPLLFGFRQKYSTSFALIHLTETIKEALDQRKYGCGIFDNIQKAFDTVDHNILMGKLKHANLLWYKRLAYSWFESYVKGRKQYVSIYGFNSTDLPISYGVPQGSVLGTLFLIYINDLHTAIRFCKVHHFVGDTNLRHISKSIKKLNKFVNFDLKNLSSWLNANRISLNVSKTELIKFKPRMEKVDFDLNLKLNGKRLYPTKFVKYLDIKIDNSLTWNEPINEIVIKLN